MFNKLALIFLRLCTILYITYTDVMFINQTTLYPAHQCMYATYVRKCKEFCYNCEIKETKLLALPLPPFQNMKISRLDAVI